MSEDLHRLVAQLPPVGMAFLVGVLSAARPEALREGLVETYRWLESGGEARVVEEVRVEDAVLCEVEAVIEAAAVKLSRGRRRRWRGR